jgi:methylthioribose-1-phosphate isomerase
MVVSNVYFEIVPAALITEIISEEGAVERPETSEGV